MNLFYHISFCLSNIFADLSRHLIKKSNSILTFVKSFVIIAAYETVAFATIIKRSYCKYVDVHENAEQHQQITSYVQIQQDQQKRQ
jgi:hypothetical protein